MKKMNNKNLSVDNTKKKELENEIKNEGEELEDVEGYTVCASSKQRCLSDCSGGPIMSTLN